MEVLNFIGNISNVAGAIGGVVAAIGVVKMLAASKRQAEVVEVILCHHHDGEKVILPLEMLRRDISRAELLGRIGMLPMRQKGARFSIRALSSREFFAGINKVVDGKTSELIIPVSREELEQFEL